MIKEKMKNEMKLLIVGLVIVGIIGSFTLPVMAGEAYSFDVKDVVKYSHCYAPQWIVYDNPTMITQNLHGAMTITANVPDEYYRSELGTIGECVQAHKAAEQIARDEIMTNAGVTVDLYVYGEEYYPCVLDRTTGKISITLTGDDVPPVGSWVALRFCNVECDTYDKTIYAPLPGTLLNEWKVPQYGEEIPLTVLGLSPIYC